jgi:hypothetical protein
VAFNHHFVAARLHLLFDLSDAWLVKFFAFEAHLLAFVAAGQRANTKFQAFPVIMPSRVFHRLSLVRVADRLAAMTAF